MVDEMRNRSEIIKHKMTSFYASYLKSFVC